ncbi:MAG: trehalose-6-phosphate synthase [Candidatus Abyssobacteria bacterium SURF_5]|uniref:Glucosylglycerol-phosphate synthase n=1 Tax=Abyssobacteria bacterium (strain SURF_5) TaxID=2093360 RepID=A0A3A4P4Z6_ABYX5|nr:MAG: trehalose-6-phosphate synthase [Candidatus Abyssubacteria bacterium SURF_5]
MTAARFPTNRLIIVSNRLPVIISRGKDGKLHSKPGSGGLVTAIAPVLRNRGGVWIGWPGILQEEGVDIEAVLNEATKTEGYSFKPVLLTEEEKRQFYFAFSNQILWPVFHDFQPRFIPDPASWTVYQNVNQKFAEVTARNIQKDDYIWIHDYHLLTVARELRAMGVKNKIGFFLHIPFPHLDFFLKIPWRHEILSALLQYDLIGLQTLRDRRNFMQCIRAFHGAVRTEGKGQVIMVRVKDREVRIGGFAISIDYDSFVRRATSKEVADQAWYIHEALPNRQLILGIDRLDYTKGITNRLEAFRYALQQYPDLREKVTFIQVVVPSRENIPEYQNLKMQIERLVGEINGQFTVSGWVPIHYIYRSLDPTELLAYYRAAEIALVTPLKDGMNLVSKEYCACSLEEECVLILSEFAGSAAQMHRGALLVNPYSIEEISNAINHAYHMSRDERRKRMKNLRRLVDQYDIFWWVDSFLRAAFTRNLDDFPLLEDYQPQQSRPSDPTNFKMVSFNLSEEPWQV